MTNNTAQDRLLKKVRALLAKAESTSFAEEAAALTAKAHELIAIHAIDLALISEQTGRGEIQVVRLFIEAPYPKEKFLLLSAAATAHRSRAVLGIDQAGIDELVSHGRVDELAASGKFATLIGYRSDLDSVELLFTSLLLQAVNVMLAQRSAIDEYGHNRTKSFRRSFLAGFAYTVGDRLKEGTDRVAKAADVVAGGSVLPVLASRADQVDQHVDEQFPRLGRLRTSVSNGDGVLAGQDAGRNADIGLSKVGTVARELG